MVVELTAAGSVVSTVCVHNTVVCISSSKQQCTQRACRSLNVTTSSLMAVVSVICHDRVWMFAGNCFILFYLFTLQNVFI